MLMGSLAILRGEVSAQAIFRVPVSFRVESVFFPCCSLCSVHVVRHLTHRCLPHVGGDMLSCDLLEASLCEFSPFHLQLLWD